MRNSNRNTSPGRHRRWNSRNVTIRVKNNVCGRVDVHRNISRDEISWFTTNPNLEVEVLEMKFNDKKDA